MIFMGVLHHSQIEEAIRKFPGVADVGVFGVPSLKDQEHVAAAVVKKRGQVLNMKELIQHLESSFERHKHLHGGLFLVDALPKNPQGKLERKSLLGLVQQ
jgi:acyl-coenzyme A synthetase/AMP-(fatty) acid ligase